MANRKARTYKGYLITPGDNGWTIKYKKSVEQKEIHASVVKKTLKEAKEYINSLGNPEEVDAYDFVGMAYFF